MKMTSDTYRRIAAYASARYDETTASLFEASAAAGAMTEVFQAAMRPWLEGMLVQLGAPYTPEELKAKSDAFLLGYLAVKLANEMGPAPSADAPPEASAPVRADARALLTQRQGETAEQFDRRVDTQANLLARERTPASRPVVERERESGRDHADASWRETLRSGNKQRRGGVDK